MPHYQRVKVFIAIATAVTLLVAFLTRRETRKHNANVMRRLEQQKRGLGERLEQAGRAIPPLTDEARDRMLGRVSREISLRTC